MQLVENDRSRNKESVMFMSKSLWIEWWVVKIPQVISDVKVVHHNKNIMNIHFSILEIL